MNDINMNTHAITTPVRTEAPAVHNSDAPTKVDNVQTASRQEQTPSGNSVPVNSHSNETPSRSEVQAFVSQMQDHVQNMSRDLKFSIDEESGRTIVKVIDPETDEVVRQIPSEEILDLMHAVKDGSSLLVKAEA